MRALYILALLSFSTSAQAAIIFTENFNGSGVGTYLSGSTVGGFTVTAGSVDVVGTGFFPELCTGATTGNCVDLSGLAQGTIATVPLSLSVGSYTLSFVLNGSQRGVATSTTVAL